MSLVANLTTKEKVALFKELYHDIADKGRDGDCLLAHINPEEARLLKANGGSGTINPETGLPEYKKAIKTIATVGAFAAGAYALAGGAAFGGALTSLSGIGGTIGSILSSPISSALGLGFNVYSQLQARKYAGKQADYAKQQSLIEKSREETAQRYAMAQARRQRLAAVREQRLKTGEVLAATGAAGLGTVGTSGFTGSVGSLSTQAAANIGDINVAESHAATMSNLNIAAANLASKGYQAGAKSAGWTQMADLASSSGFTFKNIFDIKPMGT